MEATYLQRCVSNHCWCKQSVWLSISNAGSFTWDVTANNSVWLYHRLCYRAVFNDSYIPSYTPPTLYECTTDCVTGLYSMTHTYHPTHCQLFMNVSPIVLQGCIQWLIHTILHTANSLWMYHRLCYRAVFNDSYIPSYTLPTLYECITDCVTGLYSMTHTYHPTHCQLFMNVSPIVLQGRIQWLIHTILHTANSLWMYHRLCYRAVFNDSYIPSYTSPTLYECITDCVTGLYSMTHTYHPTHRRLFMNVSPIVLQGCIQRLIHTILHIADSVWMYHRLCYRAVFNDSCIPSYTPPTLYECITDCVTGLYSMTHTYYPTHRRLCMNVPPIVLQGRIQWLIRTILHTANSVWMYHRLCYRAVFNDSYIPSYTPPTLYECITDCVTGLYSMTRTYHPTHRRLFMIVSPIVLQGRIQWLIHTILHTTDSVWMYHRLCYRAVFNDSYIPSYTPPTLYECITDCVTGLYSRTHTYHPTHCQLFMNVSPIVLQGCIQGLIHTILHTADSLWMYHRLCYRAVFKDSYIPSYTLPTLYECITDCVSGLYSRTHTYHPTHCQLFMNVSPIVLQGCIQWLIHTILHIANSLWMYHRLCYRAVFNDSYIPSYTPPTLYECITDCVTGLYSMTHTYHPTHCRLFMNVSPIVL